MNQNKLKNIVIIALLLMTIGLGWMLVTNKEETGQEKMIYQGYHDDLLKIKNEIKANVVANLVEENHYVALYIESKEEKSILLDISLKIIDEKNQTFYRTNGYTSQLTKDGKVATLIPIPELDHTKLKEMILEVKQGKGDAKDLDLTQFTFENKSEVDEFQNTTITSTMTYNGSGHFTFVSGAMVAWKENKIIRLIEFGLENVEQGNTPFPFGLLIESKLEKINETTVEERPREYDRIETFVSDYE